MWNVRIHRTNRGLSSPAMPSGNPPSASIFKQNTETKQKKQSHSISAGKEMVYEKNLRQRKKVKPRMYSAGKA